MEHFTNNPVFVLKPQERVRHTSKVLVPKVETFDHRADFQGMKRQSTNWVHPNTAIPFHRMRATTKRIAELGEIIGEKPDHWRKPAYGHLDYIIAWRMGWISDEDEKRDRAKYELRRKRSLETCHTPSRHYWRGEWIDAFENGVPTCRSMPHQTGAYVPEVPAHLLHDQDLTDGARRCMFKLLEETYRMNRDHRWLATTVPYLMQALKRSRRTIQNYLRLLELCGYITCEVILSNKTRMCNGLRIILDNLAFPQHHGLKWPQKKMHDRFTDAELQDRLSLELGEPGAQAVTLNYWTNIYNYRGAETTSVILWAIRCMGFAHKRFMQNNAPPD